MAGVTGWQLQKLLRSAKHSDFKIVCKDATFFVHKNILGSTSEYFRALFEDSFKESIEGTVNFGDDEPEVIGTLLYFLYTGIYVKQASDEFNIFVECARNNSRYCEGTVPVSMTGSSKNQPGTVKSTIDNMERHILTYAAADRLGITQAIPKIVEYFNELDIGTLTACERFPEYLEMVYENTCHNDAALRFWFTKQCIEAFAINPVREVVDAVDAVDDVVATHEPGAWLVGRHYKAQLEAASMVLRGLEGQKMDLQSKLAAFKVMNNTLLYDRDNMSVTLNDLDAENKALREDNERLQRQMETVKKNNEKRVRRVMKQVGGMSPGGTYYHPGEQTKEWATTDDYSEVPRDCALPLDEENATPN